MEGSRVERFHTRPLLKPDTDGRHSHGVAMLCYLLTEGDPSMLLLLAALLHDLGEQVAGDVSSPAKRLTGIAKLLKQIEEKTITFHGFSHLKLTEEEATILYLADQFDGMLTCCRERAMGNKLVDLPMMRWMYYMDHTPLTEKVRELDRAIREVWQEAKNNVHGPQFDCFAALREVEDAEPTVS